MTSRREQQMRYLPPLPDGYFWRISLGTISSFKIQLRMWIGEKRKFSVCVDSSYIRADCLNTDAGFVARTVLARYKAKQTKAERWHFLGNYPTKTFQTLEDKHRND